MKPKFLYLIPLSIFLCASFAAAQGRVKDGEFTTQGWLFWSKAGGHYGESFVLYETDGEEPSLCYMKKPNTDNGNGSIFQEVELLEGVTYDFHAYVAAYKPC